MKRVCGDCQLCCRLLPTEELGKPALQRCPHQKHGVGCRIYAKRPMSCQLWNCRWLVDDSTGDLPRPDRAHYVIDLIPDFITVTDNNNPEAPPVYCEVIQVWVDPAYKLAHRAASFRHWLAGQGKPALIRYSSKDGFLLIPPALNADGVWIEHTTKPSGRTHSLEEKAAALGGTVEIQLEDDSGNCVAYRANLTVNGQKIPIGTLPASSRAEAARFLESAERIRQQREESKS